MVVFERLVRLLLYVQRKEIMSDIKDIVVKEGAPVQVFNSSLPVTRDMLNALTEQRKLLGEFVSSQLRKDNDYGVIPGTKKASLYKPGAEKIRTLFGLTIKLDCTNQTINRDQNFAMFTYKASVFKGDNLIAECEGSTNSQEKKYKERTTWVYSEKTKKKEAQSEVTPIFDVMNTLQKMAQKRAFVGAVIMAVGASDFFTQDIDDPEDAKTIGVAASDSAAPSSIPNVTGVSSTPQQNNQGGKVTVRANVSYDDRQQARDAGFRYNKETKQWLKEISRAELDSNSYPFKVIAV
jgi:hypothetical protein